MRSVAPVPSCFLFLFLSISLRAAFPLQTPAPKAAATARNESRSADRNSCTLPAQSIIPGGAPDNFKEFDDFTLPLGKLGDEKFTNSQHLEGKMTRIVYVAPEGRSVSVPFKIGRSKTTLVRTRTSRVLRRRTYVENEKAADAFRARLD